MMSLLGHRGRRGDYPAAIPERRPDFDPAAAHAAWAALQMAGGLVSAADLRERWGTPAKKAKGDEPAVEMRPLSKARIHQYTHMPDFPAPVEERRGGALWLAADVDQWMRSRIDREGRPGPSPRHAEGDR